MYIPTYLTRSSLTDIFMPHNINLILQPLMTSSYSRNVVPLSSLHYDKWSSPIHRSPNHSLITRRCAQFDRVNNSDFKHHSTVMPNVWRHSSTRARHRSYSTSALCTMAPMCGTSHIERHALGIQCTVKLQNLQTNPCTTPISLHSTRNAIWILILYKYIYIYIYIYIYDYI